MNKQTGAMPHHTAVAGMPNLHIAEVKTYTRTAHISRIAKHD